MAGENKSPESPYGAVLETIRLLIKALGPSAPILITIISIWVAYNYGNSINQEARVRAENSLAERQNQLNEAYSSFSDRISSIGTKQLETIDELYSSQEQLRERQFKLNELEIMNQQAIAEAQQNQAELTRLRSENRDITQKINDLTQKNQATNQTLEQLTTENANMRQALAMISNDDNVSYLADASILAIQNFTAPNAGEAASLLQQAIDSPNGVTIENLQRLRGVSTEDLQSILGSIENSSSIIAGRQGLGNPTAWVITGKVGEHELGNVTVIWSAGGRVTEVMNTKQLLYAEYLTSYDWFTPQYDLFSTDTDWGGLRQYYLSTYGAADLPGNEIFRILVGDRAPGNWNFQDMNSETSLNEIVLLPLPMSEWTDEFIAQYETLDYGPIPVYELYKRSRNYAVTLDRKNSEVPERVYQFLEQLLSLAGRREWDSLQDNLLYYSDSYLWGNLGSSLVTNEIDFDNISFSKSGEEPSVSYQMVLISRNVDYNERTRWQIIVNGDTGGDMTAELTNDYQPLNLRL